MDYLNLNPFSLLGLISSYFPCAQRDTGNVFILSVAKYIFEGVIPQRNYLTCRLPKIFLRGSRTGKEHFLVGSTVFPVSYNRQGYYLSCQFKAR
jgi:hypothetical protein